MCGLSVEVNFMIHAESAYMDIINGFVSWEKYRQAVFCCSSVVRMRSVDDGRKKLKSNFVKSVPKESKSVIKCNSVTRRGNGKGKDRVVNTGRVKERIGL